MNDIFQEMKNNLTFILQIASFVWFMAKLNTTVAKMATVLDKAVDRLDEHGERIAHIEGKLEKA